MPPFSSAPLPHLSAGRHDPVRILSGWPHGSPSPILSLRHIQPLLLQDHVPQDSPLKRHKGHVSLCRFRMRRRFSWVPNLVEVGTSASLPFGDNGMMQ